MAEFEVVKPIHVKYKIKSTGRQKHIIYCGACGIYSTRVYMGDAYCRKCGTKVDWSDS